MNCLVNKKYFTFILIILFAQVFVNAQTQPDLEQIKASVQFLSSDELEGRFPGTDGNIKAGDFILSKFREYGLTSLNDSFEQFFDIPHKLKYTEKNSVAVTKLVEKPGLPPEMWTKAVKKWTPGNEFQPVGLSKSGTVSGEMAFVGYGISAKELNYDDYDGIDVKGKVVIVLSDSADGKPLDSRFTNYATLKYKASNALDHGAVGIIFIKRLSDSANTYYPLKLDRFAAPSELVAVQANRSEIAKFFPKEKNLYPAEMKLMETKKPQSFILPNCSVSLTVELITEETSVRNIYGCVKGTDPLLSKEYIVVGAHYDHIGWGVFNSNYKGKPSIHNGADDNASGVSGMLELARITSLSPMRRTVIFVAFNSEEMGLLGSDYFVKNPPVPISDIVTMINFDMIGRMNGNLLTVFGTGTSDVFNSMIDAAATNDSLSISKNSEGYGPSDQASFENAKVPVMFMFTGAHLDYHSPGDDFEKINVNGLAKVVLFTDDILKSIDKGNDRPKFVSQMHESKGAQQGRGKEGISVSFGSIPDFSKKTGEGFVINGCRPGSPCEKAGLKQGDIITFFGNNTVKDIGEFTAALRTMKPGDIISIKYIRDGKEMESKAEMVSK